MCWNEYVSINTFVFGIFVLLLIAFNNKYSKYKITEFENPYTYFFMVSFISMQFIEFILWRNLNNKFINKTMSILGSLLLVIQPIASLTMLENIDLRNKMILVYSIPAFVYFCYNIINKNIDTIVSKTGHLKWNWIPTNLLGYLFYLFFLYFSLFINRKYIGILLSFPLFSIFYYYYYTDGTAGSLWCWSVNIIMLYYLIKVLIYLPLFL
jgi:hypothetical protein